MYQYAIISDIHSNLAALEAVLEDIGRLGVKGIWCLGDIVGYGPQPVECFHRVMETCSITILGNHEKALVPGGGERFNSRALRAIEWTRQSLAAAPNGTKILEQCVQLPQSFKRKDILFTHGSPANLTDEYLFPKDAANQEKMAPQFEAFEHYAFVGHTHFPGVFEEGEPFMPPEQMLRGNLYMLDGACKAIINVGSVGQPRDNNTKACYVTFDGDSVVYRRVEYEVEKTASLIRQIDMLDNSLAERLLKGK